jgi:protein-export membrane protein SecD
MACAVNPAHPSESSAQPAYVILELDAAALRRSYLETLTIAMTERLEQADPAIAMGAALVEDDVAHVFLVNPGESIRALSVLQEEIGGSEISLSAANAAIAAEITSAGWRTLRNQALTQDLEIIRRRLNPTGRGAIRIVVIGEDRILVEANDVSIEEIKSELPQPERVTFHLVFEADVSADSVSPADAGMLAEPHPDFGQEPLVVERRPILSGARLARANPSTDPAISEFVLSFQFDDEGRRIFCEVTGENVGRRFAILLDGQVVTAPRIHEPICEGAGQIAGSFTAESANQLAMLLRRGALPAAMTIVEEGYRTPAPD